MIVNTRAGSRGARRTHPWGRARRAEVTVGASAVIWASVRLTWRWNWSSRRPVRVADGLGVELSLRERRRHGLLAGDGRAHLLADIRPEILELGDVQELHAGVGHRLERGMRRVGRVD